MLSGPKPTPVPIQRSMNAQTARALTKAAPKSPEIERLMKVIHTKISQAARSGESKTALDFGHTFVTFEQRQLIKQRLREEGYRLSELTDRNETQTTIHW